MYDEGEQPKVKSFLEELSRLKDFTLMLQYVRRVFNDNLALKQRRKKERAQGQNKINFDMFEKKYYEVVEDILRGLTLIEKIERMNFSPAKEEMKTIHARIDSILGGICSSFFVKPK